MLFTLAAVVLAASAALSWSRQLRDRAGLTTGGAEWIWYARAGRKPRPLHFYATRDVDLASPPRRAEARVFVDPDAVLFVNGRRVGDVSRRAGDPLAVFDLAPSLRAGPNRIAIEASSPDGVGGILFALEGEGIDPEAFASGRRWRVDLDASALERGARYPAVVWGRPPQYPWGYPKLPAAAR